MNKASEILTSVKYLNGRFFRDGVMRKTVFGQTNCVHKDKVLTFKIAPKLEGIRCG